MGLKGMERSGLRFSTRGGGLGGKDYGEIDWDLCSFIIFIPFYIIFLIFITV
jgi:hypothetical protein